MSERKSLTQEQIAPREVWQVLQGVKDPEIPVVSIVEMGIVRDVTTSGDRVTVKITPTFSGCPALHVIKDNIEASILGLGATSVSVETALFPPWSSDWISEGARRRLKVFGLAPPPIHRGRLEVTFYDLAACPYCDATDTVMKNAFGPTLCRSIYYCNNCQQPFEQFKAL